LIQGVIARLGTDGFAVKGWAITITGALLGFAVSGHKSGLAILATAPVLAFWGLDTYFLRAERLFRALYNAVRLGSEQEPFFMAATSHNFIKLLGRKPRVASWLWAAFAPTVWGLYVPLLVVSALVAVFV
jgi:hypothetical protein